MLIKKEKFQSHHYLSTQRCRLYFRFLLVFLIIGFSTNYCLAQQYKIDSLKSLIQSQVHDTVRLNTMIALAKDYRAVDYQKSIEVSLQVIKLSQKLKDIKSEALGYKTLGSAYAAENYLADKAFKMLDKALEIANITNDSILKADVLISKGMVYQKMGLEDKALSIYTEALRIAEENEAKLMSFGILNNIAVMLQERSDNKGAIVYYQSALKIIEELKHERYMAILNNNIGNLYKQMNKKDTALIYLENALAINRKIEEQYSVVLALGNISNLYIENKDYKQGRKYISEAYKLAKELDYSYGQSFSLSVLAKQAYNLEEHDQTIKYALEGLEIGKKVNKIRLDLFFYDYLQYAYFNLEKYQESFEAQKNYHRLKDSIYNTDQENHINDLLVEYKTKQKETENEILSTTISKQKNQQYFLVTLLFASIGIFTAIISVVKVRQVEKIEQMRFGIAQDLHDEIGSKLTLIQIFINNLHRHSNNSERKKIVKSEQEANKVIKDTHFAISDLVWAISPKTNTMKDLIKRLNDYTGDFLGSAGVNFELNYGSFNLDKKLNPNLRQNIVFFFKETLNNILKHTNSSIVTIKLFNVNNVFTLEVVNEFKSIKTDSVSGGRGLLNMQKRAKDIGGEILIDQQPNCFKVQLITKAFA